MGTARTERAALVRLMPVLASSGAMRWGHGMTLRKRIWALDPSQLSAAALEAMAEAYGESLDCPDNFLPALLARIDAAQEAGTCPQSLSDADLLALLYAYDAMEGQT